LKGACQDQEEEKKGIFVGRASHFDEAGLPKTEDVIQEMFPSVNASNNEQDDDTRQYNLYSLEGKA